MPRHALRDRNSDPIDKHVGNRLRERRIELGLSQSAVGRELGITFQQLQKNEWGINRIGASRLYMLSKILDVPIAYFFEGLSDEARKQMDGSVELDESAESAPSDQDILKLVNTYYRIRDPKLRSKLLELCKSLGHDAN